MDRPETVIEFLTGQTQVNWDKPAVTCDGREFATFAELQAYLDGWQAALKANPPRRRWWWR